MQRENHKAQQAGSMLAQPDRRFRLLRYFTLASLAAFLPAAATLLYLELQQGDFFKQVQLEQSAFFKQAQYIFAQQHDAAARADLLSVQEAGNINLTRLFANALWEKDFAPFVAKVQAIPVAHCREIADVTDAAGKSMLPPEKKSCYAGIGKTITALAEFNALDAKVFDSMNKSTVFKIKVYDLRGITVYSTEHGQIGEDQIANTGWKSAVGGKPVSDLVHRNKFNALEGVVENRDLIQSYIPVRAPGSGKIAGVFEVYSDVTQFLDQIKNTSARIGELAAKNQTEVDRAAAANQEKVEASANWLLAIVLGLLTLLYLVLLVVVRGGQRLIDEQDFVRTRIERALHESEARFRSLTEMSSDFYWESDVEHRLTKRGSAGKASTVSVFERGAQIGERRWEIPYLSPDEAGWRTHREVLDAHLPFRDFELSRLGSDGTERYILISGDPMFDESGAFMGYRGVGTDITARKQSERALRESLEKLRLFADNVPAMTVSYDENLRCRFANKAFAGFFGFTVENILGTHLREVIGEEAYGEVEDQFQQVLRGHPVTYQRTHKFSNGESRHLEVKLLPHFGGPGQVLGCFAVTTDITEHKLTEERIRRMAHHDSLTGLPNRLLFNDRLSQAISLAKRDGHQFALLYLDLDKFKPVNDALGHAAGDELLKGVATRIRQQVRESDTVARVGGDEFTVILPDIHRREEAETVARKIIATLAAPFQLGPRKQSIDIGISIGIAVYPADGTDADALVNAADAAMYSAKQAGNSVRFGAA